MAIISTTASGGYFENGSTWAGGAVPGPSDQFVVAAGATLRVRDERAHGTSPGDVNGDNAANLAFDVTPTGRLIIEAGGWLKVRGPWRVQNTASQGSVLDGLTVEAGGRLSFDPTASAVPGTAKYRGKWGTDGALWNHRRLTMDGILDTLPGGAAGFIASDFGVNFVSNAGSYATVRRLGDASTRAFVLAAQDDNRNRAVLEDVWFDQTGGVNSASGLGASLPFVMRRVTFTGTLFDTSIVVQGGNSTHLVDDCSFDKPAHFNSFGGRIIGGTTFHDGTIVIGSYVGEATDCLIVNNSPNGFAQHTLAKSPLRDYRIIGRNVPNVKVYGQGGGFGSFNIVDAIVEPLGATGSDGEVISGTSGFAVGERVSSVTGMIVMPHHDGTSMRLVEILTDDPYRVDVTNCTVAAYEATLGVGHGGNNTPASDGIERFRTKRTAFLNFAPGVTTAEKIGFISNDVADSYLPAEQTQNAGAGVGGAPNLRPGRNGKAYNARLVNNTGTPGATDVDGIDPQLVGAPGGGLARLHTWARDVLGLTGTIAQREDAALAAIQVRHLAPDRYGFGASGHPSYRAGASILALYAWVRPRWAPTAAAYDLGGGAYIGAVARVVPAPTRTLASLAVTPTSIGGSADQSVVSLVITGKMSDGADATTEELNAAGVTVTSSAPAVFEVLP